MAGFIVVGAVEKDPLAAETYRSNHSHVHVWRSDIRRISASQMLDKLEIEKGELDLLAGCPPCQGFSSIRRRNKKNKKDPRNELLFDFLRFVRILWPKTIAFENVPGLLTYWRWKEFIAKLERLGYVVQYQVVNAADYGVPQRRRRLVLLGSRIGEITLPKTVKIKRTVRQVIGGLPIPGKSGDPLHDLPEKRSEIVRSRIKLVPKNGGSRTSIAGQEQLPCHQRCEGFKDVYGRMAWSDVAPTITGGCVNPSKGRFIHPTANRAITLREAALLQTFPKKYVFSLNKGKHAVALMIGNAFPPRLARAHVAPLKKVLKTKANGS